MREYDENPRHEALTTETLRQTLEATMPILQSGVLTMGLVAPEGTYFIVRQTGLMAVKVTVDEDFTEDGPATRVDYYAGNSLTIRSVESTSDIRINSARLGIPLKPGDVIASCSADSNVFNVLHGEFTQVTFLLDPAKITVEDFSQFETAIEK